MKLDQQSRRLLFFLACVPLRTALIVLAYKFRPKNNAFLIFAILVGVGFLVQYLRDNRVGGFGGDVYWNRIMHSMFYFLFAILYAMDFQQAWVVLLVDLFAGIFTVLTKSGEPRNG
jgi:cobalamin synthase